MKSKRASDNESRRIMYPREGMVSGLKPLCSCFGFGGATRSIRARTQREALALRGGTSRFGGLPPATHRTEKRSSLGTLAALPGCAKCGIFRVNPHHRRAEGCSAFTRECEISGLVPRD